MDFSLTDEQLAVQEAARAVFGGERDVWPALADSNLLGLVVPVPAGGSGLGMVELALLLEEQGRRVVPVPLWPTSVAAMAVAEFGLEWDLSRVVAGESVLTVSLGDGPVPYAQHADAVLVGRSLVEAGAVTPVDVTSREPFGFVEGVGDEPPDPWVRDHALVALCALQVGVCDAALRLTAAYTSEREQFGRPLATFQGVALRAADAYIDVEAMRVTMLQAAWRLDAGLDATAEVRVAKWWAAEAGHRVVHAAQHLHGGVGADVEYPIHRYFLWGKQLALMLGAGSEQLAALADDVC